jgi:hypothetical protein
LDDTLNYNYDRTPFGSLKFCVRELVINGQVQDFSNALDAVEVSSSCEENQCSSDACKNGGMCIGTKTSFTCICPVEFAGETCDENSDSATFSGDSFIQYEVRESSSQQREVRQTQIHTTGRNYVNLAFVTSSDTGTILQLGSDEEDEEYAILEIVDGHLQFHFNLGSGVATAIQMIQINDGRSHTVRVERKERTVTLVIDDSYTARATSPPESSTLDIQQNRIYLGARVDTDGKSSNGFTGCITGAKLDHKDLPVSGSTKDYIATPSSGVEKGCSFEPSQGGVFPTVVTIAAGGVGFLLLIVILPTGIIICISGRYLYRRRKRKAYSPRGRQASSRSPTFNWQPMHRPPDMGTSRQRLTLTQSSQVSVSDSFALQDMNQDRNEGSLFAPSTPAISERAFTTPEQTPQQPQRRRNQGLEQESHQQGNHHIRRLDFDRRADQQSHQPVVVAHPPSIPAPKTQLSNDSNSPTSAKPPPTLDTKHARSLSGHQSTVTTNTMKSEATSVFDDSEVGKYVLKRIEAANEELKSIQMDTMMPFKEEGEFEPLGSVGSLHDILRDGHENFEPVQHTVPAPSRPPLKPKPKLSSRPKHSTQTEAHTTPNGVHSTRLKSHDSKPSRPSPERPKEKLVSSQHAKFNGTPPQEILRANKPRERRRNRPPPSTGAGESLMDKFQKISTSPPHGQAEEGENFV